MTEPVENPTVSLGGIDYEVKPMVIKQMRVAFPALMRIRKMVMGSALDDMTTENYDDMARCVYEGIAPGYFEKNKTPLSYDAFTNLPIGTLEMLAALRTIARQAGMLVKKEKGDEDVVNPVGEAPAGQVEGQTGTQS